MASESRKLPDSNIKRNKALADAKTKNDELTLAGGTYLSDGTVDLLDTNQPLYEGAVNTVALDTASSVNATGVVNKTGVLLRRKCSRFIQVFGLAVHDDIHPVSDFSFYHLDKSGDLPKMDTDSELKMVVKNLVSGEAARVAAGGTAMSNPAIAEVVALNTTFVANINTQNAAITVVTASETALNALNPAADTTILMVYNEVETHFGTLSNAAIRVQGRLWGIPYEKVGSTKVVTGTVKDGKTGEAIIGANISFANGNNDDTSDATGFKLNTTLMDVQKLVATCPLYTNFSVEVTLVENENLVVNIVMTLA